MRTVLVTGANRSIGLERCRQFARREDDIIATCREASPELRETGADIHERIEVTDNNLVHGLARALQGRRIDSAGENFGRGPRTPT